MSSIYVSLSVGVASFSYKSAHEEITTTLSRGGPPPRGSSAMLRDALFTTAPPGSAPSMQSAEDGRSCRPLKSATQRRASAPRAGGQLQPLVAGDFRLLLVAACLVPAAGALKTPPPPSPPLGSSVLASDSSASRPPPLSDLLAEASRAAGAAPAGSSRDAAVSGSRRRLSSTGPPEPSASDTVVTNATHLRQLLLDGGTVSLRLEGHIALGGLPCVDGGGCTLL